MFPLVIRFTLNCNCTSSVMTSLEFHSGFGDTICFSGANEVNGKNVSEKGSLSSKDFKPVVYSHSSIISGPFQKEESAKALTVSESFSHCEPMLECLSTKECACYIFSEFSSGEKAGLVKSQKCDAVHDMNWMSYRISSETIHGMEESKNIISDHTETISFGCVSHVSSWDNDSVMSCNNDFDEGHKTCRSVGYRMKSSYRCSTDGHEVISGRRAEHGRKLSRSSNDAAYMLGHSKRLNQARKENSCSILQDVQKNVRNACIQGEKSAKSLNQAWKENSRSILQEVQKNVTNACIQGAKQSNPNHVQMGIDIQEAALLMNHKSFSTGAVLPSPVISSFRQNCTSKEVKDVWNNKQGDQTNGLILNESPQRVSQERFHGDAGPYFLQSGQNGIQKNKSREKSKAKRNQLPTPENFNHLKKLSRANKENLYRQKTEMNLPEAESLEASSKMYFYRTDNFDCLPFFPFSSAHLQQNVPYSRIEGPSDKALYEVGSPTYMNIARTYASVGSLHLYSDNEENKSTCYEIELSYEDVRQDFKSGPSLQKWIPVGRKDSSTLKNRDVVDKPILVSLKSETHQEATALNHGSIYKNSSMNNQKLLSYDVPAELRIESEMLEFDKLGDQGKCTDQTRKVDRPSDSVTMNISLLHIGSQKAEQALNEAYRLQIASESVQAATGSPLGEFERLLHSASPVIVPAYVPKRCEKCSGNQNCLESLCEHQVPKIPLIALWNWYEQPGSYGLEVKAEDSECFNVIGTHEICFHAHFVPFLSAVQLFGRSCDSKRSRAGGLVSEVVKENHSAEQLPYPISLDMKCIEVVGTKPFERRSVPILFDPTKNRRSSDFLDSNSHASSKHIKLIFEFFETEQPQQRKPLYDKIMELTKTGTACGQVFGDASKLKSLNLQDLHPASWYSVAWYPIYRIPEGNLRASFLTYHCLGHLSQRCITPADHFGEMAFCVVCPALGLQSYNTQGECWFNPKKHSYSSSKESAPSNTSDILTERLRTLEEAALLFARGYVYKGNVKVANHQPDYEFFLSRKH